MCLSMTSAAETTSPSSAPEARVRGRRKNMNAERTSDEHDSARRHLRPEVRRGPGQGCRPSSLPTSCRREARVCKDCRNGRCS